MGYSEAWKPVVGWEDLYQVSSLGRVLCTRGGNHEIMKPVLNKTNGGYSVCLTDKSGNKSKKYIHRLVAQHFLDNPNNFYEVRHKNGDKANNKVSNLLWHSRAVRVQNMYRNEEIDRLKGERNKKAYLTSDLAVKIFESELGARQLSIELGIPKSTIEAIKKGVTWSHATGAEKRYYGKGRGKSNSK